jgi:hypothetical protein
LPLDNDWHADHVIPWSLEVRQRWIMVKLLRRQKSRKGSSFALTRAWQQRFSKAYEEHEGDDFCWRLCQRLARPEPPLAVAYDWLEPTRRLIIVAPTLNVRQQWKEEARKTFGLQLLTSKFFWPPSTIRLSKAL